MNQQKLNDIEEAADRILRLSELLRVDNPVMRKRADAIIADAREMVKLISGLKKEN